MKKRRTHKGFVLVMVLVMVAAVTFVLEKFMEKGLSEMAGEGYYVQRDRLRLTAYSALDTTMAVLADVIHIDGALKDPMQGWSDPLGYAGVDFGPDKKVTISFIDETGKLPLNTLDEGTLYLLFQDMGFDADSSLTLTNSFLDWTDPDDNTRIDGAESVEYGQEPIPYEAKNKPLTRFSELRVVNGFRDLFFDQNGVPNDYYRTFEQTVSPFTERTLNINTASDLALRATGMFSDTQISSIRAYQAGADGIPGTADDRYFDSLSELTGVIGQIPRGAQIGVDIKVLRILIHVTQGSSEFTLDAVVSLTGTSAQNVTNSSTKSSSSSSARTSGSRSFQTKSTNSNVTDKSKQLQYPFVFLELNEQVANNNAAETTDAEPAAGTTP